MANLNKRSFAADPFQPDVDMSRQVPEVGITDAPSRALASLGDNFAAFSKEIGGWADEAAKAEGARAGAAAGDAPTFTPRRDNTIHGNAFDKAGFDTFSTRLQIQASDELQTAYLTHQKDPAALQAATKQIREKYAGQLAQMPEVRSTVDAGIATRGQGYVFAASKAWQDKQEREAEETRRVGYETSATDLTRQVAGSAARTPAQVKNIQDQIQEHVDKIDADPTLSPLQKQQAKKALAQPVLTAQTQSQISEAKTPAQVDEVLKRFDEGFAAKKPGFELVDEGMRQQVLVMGQQRKRAIETETRSIVKSAVGAIGDVTSVLEGGGEVRAEDWATARVRAAPHLDNPEVAAAWQKAQYAQGARGAFMGMSDPDRYQFLAQLQEKEQRQGLSPEETTQKAVFEKLFAQRLKAEKDDPLGTAPRYLPISVPDLPLDDAAKMGPAAQRRLQDVKELERGGKTVPLLKKHEREALVKKMETSFDGTVEVVRVLVGGFGAQGPRILKELAEEPELRAVAVAVRSGSARILGDIKAYRTATEGGIKLAVPSHNDMVTHAQKQGYDVLFDGRPRDFDMMRDAIARAVAVRLGPGVTKFDVTDTAHKRVLDQVIEEWAGRKTGAGGEYGGTAYVGGARTIVPATIRPGNFPSIVSGILPTDYAAAGLRPTLAGQPIPPGDLAQARWKPLGNDRYRLQIGDPRRTREVDVADGEAGRPLIVDFSPGSPLHERMKGRMPGLFK